MSPKRETWDSLPPSRPPNHPYEKGRLSSDAKLLVALTKRQPQTAMELTKSAAITKSLVYRSLPALLHAGAVKPVGHGFALWNYDETAARKTQLETDLEQVFTQWKQWNARGFSLNDLAFEVGCPPDDQTFKEMAYRLAKKYRMKIGSEMKHPGRVELSYGSSTRR